MRRFAIMLIALLFISSFAHARDRIEVLAHAKDPSGKAVSDVKLMFSYQMNISQSKLDGFVYGITDSSGQWRGSLPLTYSPDGEIQFVQISAYAPYWSSPMKQVQLPDTSLELLQITFTIPKDISPYTIHFQDSGGNPIQSATVLLEAPFFAKRKTDLAGNAKFQLPSGSVARGTLYYQGQSTDFMLSPKPSQESSLTISFPFEKPSEKEPPSTFYSLNAILIYSNGTPLESKEVQVSPPQPPIKVATDSRGFIMLDEIPYQKLNISWMVSGYMHSQEVDLSKNPEEIRQPSLLRVSTPDIRSLGEGCYRVMVDVTDPRENSLPQVHASAEGEEVSIPFSIDHTRMVDKWTTAFYKILCVQEDTGFLIVAQDKYETRSVRILLKQYIQPSSPKAQVNPEMLKKKNVSDKKNEETRKLEIVVLLLVLLVGLSAMFLIVHYRKHAYYLWQSVTRFIHINYKAFRISRERKTVEIGSDIGSGTTPPVAEGKSQQADGNKNPPPTTPPAKGNKSQPPNIPPEVPKK